MRTNLSDAINGLYELAKSQAEVNIETDDGEVQSSGTVKEFHLKCGVEAGSVVATLTVRGGKAFQKMVSRHVRVNPRQQRLPIGEEQGEPR